MRFLFLAHLVGAAVEVSAAGSLTCTTLYTSASTFVSTTTVSIEEPRTVATATATMTYPATTVTVYPSTVRKSTTTTFSTTFWYTSASSTSTVPTTKGFTPIASATSRAGYSDKKADRSQRRRGVPAHLARQLETPAPVVRGISPRATKSFPYSVICTTYYDDIITYTSYIDTTPTSTVTVATPSTSVSAYYTWVATTSTVTTSTRTVHAACATNNVINTFDNRLINGWGAQGFKTSLFASPSDPNFTKIRAAGQSPVDCCEAIWASGYGGFIYSGAPGYSGDCVGVSGGNVDFHFNIGPYGGQFYVGNGVNGNAFFGGFDENGYPNEANAQ